MLYSQRLKLFIFESMKSKFCTGLGGKRSLIPTNTHFWLNGLVPFIPNNISSKDFLPLFNMEFDALMIFVLIINMSDRV